MTKLLCNTLFVTVITLTLFSCKEKIDPIHPLVGKWEEKSSSQYYDYTTQTTFFEDYTGISFYGEQSITTENKHEETIEFLWTTSDNTIEVTFKKDTGDQKETFTYHLKNDSLILKNNNTTDIVLFKRID